MSDFSTIRAHALALVTQIVAFIVAFIPSVSSAQQILISAGGTVLAAVILVAHAVRSRPAGENPEKAVEQLVAHALGNIDFGVLAQDAIRGSLPALVAAEVRKLLGVGAQTAPAPPSAPVVAVPPVSA